MSGTATPTWFKPTTPGRSFWAMVVWTAAPTRIPATNSTRPRMGCSLQSLICDLLGTRLLRRWFRIAPALEDQHLVVAVRVEDLGVRLQEQRDGVRPRLHVRLGIVDGDGDPHVAEVGSLPAFGHTQGVTVRVRHVGAEPAAIAES